MPQTIGLNHLGLTVKDLETTAAFFTECLGWAESGRDESYPRTAVSDGSVRLTLWQSDRSGRIHEFDRRSNVGLHHLALGVPSEAALMSLAERVSVWPGVKVEFQPELVGKGPRRHMMLYEPGGIRIEFIWHGESSDPPSKTGPNPNQ